MEQELLVRQEIPLQASRFIEQAICNIYEMHPHEIHMILFTAVSLVFGYSAYNEYKLITRTVHRREA